jgi:hypothetical protein
MSSLARSSLDTGQRSIEKNTEEDVMKNLINRTAIVATLIAATAATAHASGAATNKVFISGPLILLFIGFCALVVVAQIFPVITTLYSMLKGVRSRKEAPAEAKSN